MIFRNILLVVPVSVPTTNYFSKNAWLRKILLKSDLYPDLVHSQLQNSHSVLVHFQKQDPDPFQLRSDTLPAPDRMVSQLQK